MTKERIPYSSEAEWRLFSDFSELEEGENGKKFDFLKARAIVMGRNIERNLDFRDRVREVLWQEWNQITKSTRY